MFRRAGTRLNCYRSRRIRPKAKWPPAASKGCAFEKDLDALKRNLNFHSLRRTATTLLHEAGVPAAVARALTWHDSEVRSTTERNLPLN